MSLFFRIFQHLLPRTRAWSLTVDRALRRFFLGLSEEPAAVRKAADAVFWDLFPATTRSPELWERQFGLPGTGTLSARRKALAAAWRVAAGQSPRALEDALQAAGFPVYVHEWWWDEQVIGDELTAAGGPALPVTLSGRYHQLTGLRIEVTDYSGPTDPPVIGVASLEIRVSLDGGATWTAPIEESPFTGWTLEIPGAPGALVHFPAQEYYPLAPFEPTLLPLLPHVARDPRLYAEQPLTGSFQCEATDPPECVSDDTPGAAYCNEFLAVDPHYLVNLDLTRRAPLPLPADPDRWRYVFYLGGESFPERARIDRGARRIFETLVQKLKPSQQWVVLLVDFVWGPAFDPAVWIRLHGDEPGAVVTPTTPQRYAAIPNGGALGGRFEEDDPELQPEVADGWSQGPALAFDGSLFAFDGRRLVLSTPPEELRWLHDGTTDYAAGIVFRADSIISSFLFSTCNGSISAVGVRLMIDATGEVLLTISSSSAAHAASLMSSAGTVSVGSVHRVIWSVESGVVSLYVDGALADTAPLVSPSAADPQHPLVVGAPYSGASPLRGDIADLIVAVGTLPTVEELDAHLAQSTYTPP